VTRQLLISADDINLFCENINTVKRSTEALLGASEKVGLRGKGKKKLTIYSGLVTRLQNKTLI
jgi:hypothetical protein